MSINVKAWLNRFGSGTAYDQPTDTGDVPDTPVDAEGLRDLESRMGAYTDTRVATAQPLDSDLTAIAALTTTSFGRSLLALADAAAGRTALNAETAGAAASEASTRAAADAALDARVDSLELAQSGSAADVTVDPAVLGADNAQDALEALKTAVDEASVAGFPAGSGPVYVQEDEPEHGAFPWLWYKPTTGDLTAYDGNAGGGGGTPYSDLALSYSPAGYWRVGEASGTSAADASGNNHTGTYVGSPTLGATGLITGDADTCLTTASGKYMTVPAFLPSGQNAWSLTAWVYPTAIVGGAGIISDGYDGSPDGKVHFGLALGLDAGAGSNQLKCGFFDGGSWRTVADPGSTLSVNTRYLLAGTWDGTTLRLYRNGTEAANSTPGGTSGNDGTPAPYYIGRSYDGTIDWVGQIDEPKIFDRALTAEEITDLYAAGTGA